MKQKVFQRIENVCGVQEEWHEVKPINHRKLHRGNVYTGATVKLNTTIPLIPVMTFLLLSLLPRMLSFLSIVTQITALLPLKFSSEGFPTIPCFPENNT